MCSAARARAQQQTSHMSLLLSIDGTDGRTDTVVHTMRAASMNMERKCADTIGTVSDPWAGHFQC